MEISCKGKYRAVILPESLCKALAVYAKERGIESGSIFITRTLTWTVTSSEGEVGKITSSDTSITIGEGGEAKVIIAILDLYDPAAFADVTVE